MLREACTCHPMDHVSVTLHHPNTRIFISRNDTDAPSTPGLRGPPDDVYGCTEQAGKSYLSGSTPNPGMIMFQTRAWEWALMLLRRREYRSHESWNI